MTACALDGRHASLPHIVMNLLCQDDTPGAARQIRRMPASADGPYRAATDGVTQCLNI
ncbi:hypothetical protein K788_0004273 (plasmid) [Paraburkholderia caribensis MBA4]|uniref:Uncharacterized protein n=1 Tax=Paraburkholderia caribensis MBA4 TaxID=1323664 RepID=A0A0P0RP74_9BURK|nr:hypothetical protein K788_0004273 [Paraburkholderia caribensis MBA4]